MNEVVALVLILLLALSGYAAGRVHGQFGYRMGYRYGYRQGYFDGDRASWNRRRRDLQAAVASVLHSPPDAYLRPDASVGTTYTSTAAAVDPVNAVDGDAEEVDDQALDGRSGRHSRATADTVV